VHRTFSNHVNAGIARCVEFFNMISEWFDCTEPSLSIYLYRVSKVCRVHHELMLRDPTCRNNVVVVFKGSRNFDALNLHEFGMVKLSSND
jgi:hypothetical protein